MTQTDTVKDLVAKADGSGYRAAGLCAASHPSGVLCTKSRGHAPGHANPYVRKSVTDAVGLRW